ncbi:MAG: TetR family transcriptional regulator [Micrococcaceae bacterium]
MDMGNAKDEQEKQVGRRAGNVDTKNDISQAAIELFSKNGMKQTTMRQIATRAKVDPALIVHYFCSKKQLFLDSVVLPLKERELELFEEVFSNPDNTTVGERLSRAFATLIVEDEESQLFVAIIRSAASDEEAVDIMRNVVKNALLNKFKDHIPGPNRELKASILGAQMLGIVMARYIIKLEPIASATVDDLVLYLAPRVQTYFE